MKNLLLIIFICLSIVSYSQFEKYSMVEIRIKSGETMYGTTSFKLLQEGFVYRQNSYIMTGIEETVKFISFKNLDSTKVYELQKYIHKERLYEIEELDEPCWTTRHPIIIEFIVLEDNKYKKLYYQCCDERIDKLINLMNELILEEDRKEYKIFPRCENK